MITKEKFYCERCNGEFNSKYECEEHEKNCGVTKKFVCDKCGKVTEYLKGTPRNADECFLQCNIEGCHTINLGRPGYGSKLDGCDVEFNLCDDCLVELIESFTLEGQANIHNSGSNTYGTNEEWIRYQKGEMTDEEIEEYGCYSPRQIKAYQERFPMCNKVKIIEYSDGSKGSRCINLAHGEEDGTCDKYNISNACYQCKYFEERGEKEEILIIKED